MSTNSNNRDRRDWTLIIFLLPIGILLMVLAGQFAIRLVPIWSVDGGMGSSLDPASASGLQSGLIPPISFDILTPMGWLDTFLTPGPDSANQGLSFPPFVVFEPSATPSASASPAVSDTPATPSGTPTGVATSTGTATSTHKPPGGGGGGTPTTPAPPTTCTDPLATNNGGPLPCTYPPTTCTDPLATNNGGPLPCTYPPTTCTDPLANNNGGPLPCIYPSPTAPVGVLISGTPAGYNPGIPDGSVGAVTDGQYVVINLGPNPIIVSNPADTNYDFVYYELVSGSGILMDRVILSISQNDIDYYVVFHWGDNVPDTNSNLDTTTMTDPPVDPLNPEADNEPIDASNLYQDPSAPASPKTGVLVDVDNAPSHPPAGSYGYLAIQAPIEPDPNVDTTLDVDSVDVTEVPIPTP